MTLPLPLNPEKKKVKTKKNKTKRKAIIARCRQFFTFLQRQPKLEATVDYVFAASRYKIRIPSNSCIIMFTLQSCIVEKPQKNTKPIVVKPDISTFEKQYPPNTPGNLALHFARDQVFQRKVHVTITAVDSFGNFLGNLFINNKDFTLSLLEQGHARIHNRSARNLPQYDTYKKAEDAAKKELKGLWATFEETENERRTKEPAESQAAPSEKKKVFPLP